MNPQELDTLTGRLHVGGFYSTAGGLHSIIMEIMVRTRKDNLDPDLEKLHNELETRVAKAKLLLAKRRIIYGR